MFKTTVTTSQRRIGIRQQLRCGTPNCMEPVAMSCTDSLLVNGLRQESSPRMGCVKHPVEPMWQFEDGTFILFYEKVKQDAEAN